MEKSINISEDPSLIQPGDAENTFTLEDLNEEQRMIHDMALEFTDNELFTRLDEIDNHEPGLVPSLLEKAGELGLLGVSVPEEYGGFKGLQHRHRGD